GADDKGEAIKNLPAGLVSGAFASDVGVQNEPIAIEGGFVWYDVTAVTPEHDRELKDVRDKVVAAWTRNEVDTRLKAKAEEIRGRLAAGEDIAKVAAELGVEVKKIDGITRATEPTGDLTVSMRAAAFAGPKGTAQVADGVADQSKVVLDVTGAEVPPYFSGAPELAQAQQQLSQQFGLDILQQYVTDLQSSIGIRINQTALDQALGTPASGT